MLTELINRCNILPHFCIKIQQRLANKGNSREKAWKTILTSKCGVQHPFTGWNIQQTTKKKIFIQFSATPKDEKKLMNWVLDRWMLDKKLFILYKLRKYHREKSVWFGDHSAQNWLCKTFSHFKTRVMVQWLEHLH